MRNVIKFPGGMKVAFTKNDSNYASLCVIYYNETSGRIVASEGPPLREIQRGRDANNAFATLLTAGWKEVGREKW